MSVTTTYPGELQHGRTYHSRRSHVANKESWVPGNLTFTQRAQIHKLVFKGKVEEAKKLWMAFMARKFNERQDVSKPLKGFSQQLKQKVDENQTRPGDLVMPDPIG